MRWKDYKVRGVNPATGRQKNLVVSVIDDENPIEVALKLNYLQEPIQILEELPIEEPSEAQLDYARGLDIDVEDDYSKEDVSALISKKTQHDGIPKHGLIDFSIGRRIKTSRFIGKKGLYNTVFHYLPDRDRVAFFIFSIYRYHYNDRNANLDTSPKKDLFYQFADENVNDKKFMTSMATYSGQDLRFFGSMKIITEEGYKRTAHGGSMAKASYQKAVKFLHEHIGREGFIGNRSVDFSSTDNEVSDEDTKKGCIGCLIAFLAVSFIATIVSEIGVIGIPIGIGIVIIVFKIWENRKQKP